MLASLAAGMVPGWLARPAADGRTAAGRKTDAQGTGEHAPPSAAGAQARAEDFPALIAAALQAEPPGRLPLQVLFMQWFEKEPDLWPKFQELEKQHPEHAGALTAAFFTAWGWRDCAAAATALAGSSLEYRGAGMAALWQVACARGDEAGAQLEAGLYVKDWSSLERLAARDPQKALLLAANLHGTSPGLTALARGWASVDGAAAATWAAGLKEEGEGVFRAACMAWEQRNPGALERAGEPLRERIDADPILKIRPATMGAVPFVYGNPEALAAALRNPFATAAEVLAAMQRSAAVGIITGVKVTYPQPGEWSPADPAAALRELLTTPAGPARKRLAASLLHRWESSDAEAAAAFAKANSLAMPAQNVWQALLQKAEGLPLAEALRVAMPAGETPDWNALSAAIGKQVNTDPSAAAAFLHEHMEEITRGEGSWGMVLSNAASAWSQLDVNAATEWAASLPAGTMRDKAIGGLLQELSDYEPEAALKWIATMKNPNSGSTDLSGVVGDLQQRVGSYGARRAVEAAPLTPEVKLELLSHIP